MKKFQILTVAFLTIFLVWALYERNSKNKVMLKVQKLEAEYLKTTKDSDFLKDKLKALQEKVEILSREKEELLRTSYAKDEFISTLEEKLKVKEEDINKLQERLEKLENLISTLQEGKTLPSGE